MNTPGASTNLEITPVADRADLKTFITLPWRLYAEDPNWVAPLLFERQEHLDPKKNPFFQNAEVRFWLARQDGLPVGRISAQVNRAHLACHQDATGHFGFLEAIDRPDVFGALLGTAECWLQEQGLKRAVGPFSFSINDESGLLVEGFDSPPSVMMGHARPYYGARVAALGYSKVKDLICYRYDTALEPPRSVLGLVEKAVRAEGLTIRPLDFRRFQDELTAIMAIFNDAWAENWGFVPFSTAEVATLGKALKPIIRADSVAIAELNGEPVAMAVVLPNINEAAADLDGRLLPFGWAKLLWRLKVQTPKSARLPLMGVKRRYQGTALGAALAFSVIDAVRLAQRRRGVESAELSWILEDNAPVRRMIETMGGEAYKTYRLYEKALGA